MIELLVDELDVIVGAESFVHTLREVIAETLVPEAVATTLRYLFKSVSVGV